MKSGISAQAITTTPFVSLLPESATTRHAAEKDGTRVAPQSRGILLTRLAAIALGLLSVLLTSTAWAQSYVHQADFGMGQLESAYGIAIDPTTGNIIVGDNSRNIWSIFSSTGTYLSQFGSAGSGNGQFNVPGSAAIDPATHHIVVADQLNNRVQIFDSAGNYLSQFGSEGSGNGQFHQPDGVAIDPTTHNIVVADTGRVEIFDSTGVYLSQFGSPGNGNGQFGNLSPIGVAIDPTTRDIVVVDSGNSRVEIFDSTGVYLSQFGSSGIGSGQFRFPVFVAIDPSTRNIVVADSVRNNVTILDSTGVYLSQFFLAAGGEPEGVAIDPRTRNLVVVNYALGYVSIFAPASLPDLDQHGLTGSWYDAATNGQGLEVEVYPDLSPGSGFAQVSWFTFDTAAGGEDHQRWYTASGAVTSGQPSAALTIYQNTGGNFNALPTTTALAVGTATLSFASCTSGQLAYNFTDGSGRSGSIPLTRLTQNVTCATSAPPFSTNTDFAHSGNWYDASTAGQGFTVEVNPTSGALFAAWYTYAPMGAAAGAGGQRWYTAQASFTAGMRSIPVTIYETTGGIFNAPLPAAQTVAVGTGTLAFQSCAAATFSYNFTGGSSSGLSGTINLSRVGPVPPGCTS